MRFSKFGELPNPDWETARSSWVRKLAALAEVYLYGSGVEAAPTPLHGVLQAMLPFLRTRHNTIEFTPTFEASGLTVEAYMRGFPSVQHYFEALEALGAIHFLDSWFLGLSDSDTTNWSMMNTVANALEIIYGGCYDGSFGGNSEQPCRADYTRSAEVSHTKLMDMFTEALVPLCWARGVHPLLFTTWAAHLAKCIQNEAEQVLIDTNEYLGKRPTGRAHESSGESVEETIAFYYLTKQLRYSMKGALTFRGIYVEPEDTKRMSDRRRLLQKSLFASQESARSFLFTSDYDYSLLLLALSGRREPKHTKQPKAI